MKEYAQLEVSDIGTSGSVTYTDRNKFRGFSSLDELLEKHWCVTAAAIRTTGCTHERTTYLFILERERDSL